MSSRTQLLTLINMGTYLLFLLLCITDRTFYVMLLLFKNNIIRRSSQILHKGLNVNFNPTQFVTVRFLLHISTGFKASHGSPCLTLLLLKPDGLMISPVEYCTTFPLLDILIRFVFIHLPDNPVRVLDL